MSRFSLLILVALVVVAVAHCRLGRVRRPWVRPRTAEDHLTSARAAAPVTAAPAAVAPAIACAAVAPAIACAAVAPTHVQQASAPIPMWELPIGVTPARPMGRVEAPVEHDGENGGAKDNG
jgi:hypothetical protein